MISRIHYWVDFECVLSKCLVCMYVWIRIIELQQIDDTKNEPISTGLTTKSLDIPVSRHNVTQLCSNSRWDTLNRNIATYEKKPILWFFAFDHVILQPYQAWNECKWLFISLNGAKRGSTISCASNCLQWTLPVLFSYVFSRYQPLQNVLN